MNYDDFKKVLTQANLKVASAEEFRAFKAAFKDAADHFETHYRKAPLTVDAEASTSILKSQKIEDKDLEDIASHGGRPISLGKCPVATGHTLDGRDATLEVTQGKRGRWRQSKDQSLRSCRRGPRGRRT